MMMMMKVMTMSLIKQSHADPYIYEMSVDGSPVRTTSSSQQQSRVEMRRVPVTERRGPLRVASTWTHGHCVGCSVAWESSI